VIYFLLTQGIDYENESLSIIYNAEAKEKKPRSTALYVSAQNTLYGV
jgi:hypothetical protein